MKIAGFSVSGFLVVLSFSIMVWIVFGCLTVAAIINRAVANWARKVRVSFH